MTVLGSDFQVNRITNEDFDAEVQSISRPMKCDVYKTVIEYRFRLFKGPQERII